MRRKMMLLSGLLLAATWSVTTARAETVVLTTTDWPPYSGSSLDEQGVMSSILRQAFAKVGITLDVEIMPWKRAVATARKGDREIGYFPGYHCNHLPGFQASEIIGTGALGLAEKTDNPITWTSIADLGAQGLRIGTVRGYANTQEFDQRVGQGWIRAVQAQTDVANLAALAKGRVDAAVVDSRVLEFLMRSVPELKAFQGQIQFDEQPLEVKELFACFAGNEKGSFYLAKLNEGLAQLSVETIFQDYLKNID